jgi:hypothetical protein
LAQEAVDQLDELRPLAQTAGKIAQFLRSGDDLIPLADANARMTEEGFGTFDAEDAGDRTKAVARTINLSLGLLDDKQPARFAELAVFPEDADIPMRLGAAGRGAVRAAGRAARLGGRLGQHDPAVGPGQRRRGRQIGDRRANS